MLVGTGHKRASGKIHNLYLQYIIYYIIRSICMNTLIYFYIILGRGVLVECVESISNIARYFIQCDPRMPFYWHRWKKPILSLFAVFLMIFLYLELISKRNEQINQEPMLDVRWKGDDELTAIR